MTRGLREHEYLCGDSGALISVNSDLRGLQVVVGLWSDFFGVATRRV
jgi:hypothetical protein